MGVPTAFDREVLRKMAEKYEARGKAPQIEAKATDVEDASN
jgi:hypothetical protein